MKKIEIKLKKLHRLDDIKKGEHYERFGDIFIPTGPVEVMYPIKHIFTRDTITIFWTIGAVVITQYKGRGLLKSTIKYFKPKWWKKKPKYIKSVMI